VKFGIDFRSPVAFKAPSFGNKLGVRLLVYTRITHSDSVVTYT